jgi:hypothetical protein
MPALSSPFDFQKPAAYCRSAKRAFHGAACRQLRCLADALDLPPGAYSIRRRRGRMGRSGEIVLHAALVYVRVSQPAAGNDIGVMFRSCEGKGFAPGRGENFASLDLLNQPDALANRIREMCRI